MDSRGNIKNLMANFNTAPNPQTVTTHQTPAKPQAKMSVTLKTSSSGGAVYGSQSSSSSHSQKPTTQNISSDVLKLGAKFENLSNTEKTTFPKPPPLKPVAISKPLLPLSKSSPKTGSHTATSPVESSSGPTASPKSPISGLKPKPVVASLQSKVVQENVQGDIQKNKVVKTMSANNPSFLLTQQTSFKEKSANFSAEHQKDINKATSNSMPSKPPNVKPDLPKEKPDIADGSISKEKTTQDSAPKIKPLPNVFALGKCPSKPKRPPFVNLDRFTSISASINDLPPPLPIYVIPEDSEELNTAGQEESYDDVGTIQHQEQAGEDDEMYEDLEERWAENDQSDTRKEDKKKCDKEKKRFEQKKEQKVCEKKEREARKKFKLSGEIVVLQEAKARVDCKGGKNELSLTQREIIEIVRITDNPKGFWLGRNSEGLYGYVKTAALEVDHNALKVQSGQVPAEADEVYDDVGTPDGASMNDSFPPPPAVGAPPGDEVYDDVDSPLLPPPLPPANHPSVKAEEIDAKKKKKFEKEEKEFRKKFKYDGDISVLHQVIVDLALTSKKWGNKDLPLKPGEVIDVIVKPQDGKFIGRNKDGKLGYVCLLNIQQENEIYDDIGEDCIYDN